MTSPGSGAGATPPAAPRCAACGERIRPGRTPGSWTHVARLVAACDLDSDHPAVPAPEPGIGRAIPGERDPADPTTS